MLQGSGSDFAAFWLTVFPYRQPSPRGEGAPKGRIGYRRYEESGKERLKQAIYESTRAPLTRSPFPNGESKLVAASLQNRKGDARRSVDRRFSSYRQPSPRGEGAPKGRIGHWRHEREREGASQAGDLRKHPSAADAVPLPQWGRQISSGYAAILADGIPVRKALTKLCVKILVDADSAMESAFP